MRYPARTGHRPAKCGRSDGEAGAAAAGGDRVGVPDLEGLAYQIVDGIPVMLVDEARKLSAEEVEKIR